jgi:hypothetical protein
MCDVNELSRLICAVRSSANRGDAHIFLGDPQSDGADKTTVEPGNSYSPGVGTCGISVWIERHGQFYTPEHMSPDSLIWRFAGKSGMPPIVEAGYGAGPDIAVAHQLAHIGGEGSNGADFNTVVVTAAETVTLNLYLVVRDVGPAGGKIDSLEWDAANMRLTINSGVRLGVERAPDIAHIAPADDSFDSPVAALGYSLSLLPGERFTLDFKTEHGFKSPTFGDALLPEYPFSHVAAADGLTDSRRRWSEALGARVFCPDSRLTQVWERASYHILAAMETGLPRISAVNYPEFWLRDCIYMLRALDLIGRPDLARTGCEYLAPASFIGGFGAESDGPGETIWTLVKHAQITQDIDFLRGVFPDIKRSITWLERMITASEPIRLAAPNRLPQFINGPDINVICLAAKNGLIQGRMDWHTPNFFINAWSFAGWSSGSDAARWLGEDALAEQWRCSAVALDEAIAEHLLPNYGNDRDPIIAPYPSGALLEHTQQLKERFESWYRTHRLTPGGTRKPEPEWTYFEAGQINNAIMLGLSELAWTNLSGMLDDRIHPGEALAPWDVSAFVEGRASGHEYLSYRNDIGLRGWLQPEKALAGNMPHNWTSAQLILLIRNIFVTDEPMSNSEAADEVVLGRGVPQSWLIPGASWGVVNMPTRFGPVSYTATVNADRTVAVDCRGACPYRAAF